MTLQSQLLRGYTDSQSDSLCDILVIFISEFLLVYSGWRKFIHELYEQRVHFAFAKRIVQICKKIGKRKWCLVFAEEHAHKVEYLVDEPHCVETTCGYFLFLFISFIKKRIEFELE